MKEKIISYLKPSLAKVSLALALLAWQYFYSYQNIRLEFLASYGNYITSALSAFNWGDYFVRNVSLFFVWVLVAIIIFSIIWFSEVIVNFFHNFRVKRKYANQEEADYKHLLRENIRFFEHFRSRSFWIAGIIIFLISLFALSDLFERLRFSILDGFAWNAFINGSNIDFYGANYIIASFILFSVVWYFVGSLIVWLFEEQKAKEDEEKISEEHFAVEVDTKTASEEN